MMYKYEHLGKSMNECPQIQLSEFGTRLRQERERLGLSPHDFATLGEVNRITQLRYEDEANHPTVEYMYKIGQHGVNTHYILTGARSEEAVLLNNFEAFSKAIDLIDQLTKFHNVNPPAEFRGRAILRVYKQICKFGAKKVKPTLEEFLHAGSEQE
jgi:transcriptional regulator with XRE-family HTH domain